MAMRRPRQGGGEAAHRNLMARGPERLRGPVRRARLPLSEARQRGRKAGDVRNALVRVDLLGAGQQDLFGLEVLRVRHATIDRAHRGASLLAVESDTLAAQRRVDLEDLVALGDGGVRALRLARS